MRLSIESEGVAVDAELRDFVRATVVFAVWHHEGGCRAVRVRLERAGADPGEARARCQLEADTGLAGRVTAAATGPTAWEAVQKAADLLEVAIFRARTAAPDCVAA